MIRRLVKRIASMAGIQPFDSRYAIGVSTIAAHRSSHGQKRNLWDYECKVYSQWGEDGILDFLFDTLSIDKPCILEFGVGDFSECNSRFSAEYRNANLFLVDSRQDLFPSVKSSSLFWKSIIEVRNSWITPTSARELLSEASKALGRIDCVSLDIDGNDYWVLKDLDLSQVSIIVVEYNPVFGSDLAVTVPRDDEFDRTRAHHSNLYYGASLMAWIKLFDTKGFVFLGSNRVGNNAFFVSRKYSDLFNFEISDLSKFTDWRVRESRSLEGDLTYASGSERLRLIEDLPLFNTETNELTFIRDCLSNL
jgi:hypothetical protein